MKNELVETTDGRKVWISRAVAVTGIVFKKDAFGNYYVLANKRGEGAPDFNNMWNLPCGYLDYDEYGVEAVSREVFEETSYSIPPQLYKLHSVVTSPEINKQSVVLRYVVYPKDTEDLYFTGMSDVSELKGETNEVAEIDWIKIEDIDLYKWAFDHNNIIKEIYKELFD